MRRHILQTQLIGEMRVDIAQRLLHFAIVRRGRPAGLRRIVLRRVIFDNHKVELFFQAILDDQLQQIRRSDNPRIVHLRHIAKRPTSAGSSCQRSSTFKISTSSTSLLRRTCPHSTKPTRWPAITSGMEKSVNPA